MIVSIDERGGIRMKCMILPALFILLFVLTSLLEAGEKPGLDDLVRAEGTENSALALLMREVS